MDKRNNKKNPTPFDTIMDNNGTMVFKVHAAMTSREYRLHAAWLASSSHARPELLVTATTSPSRDIDSPQSLTFAYMKRKNNQASRMNNEAVDQLLKSDSTQEIRTTMLTLGSPDPEIILQLDDNSNPRGNIASAVTLPLCRHCFAPLQAGWKGTTVVKTIPGEAHNLSKTQARRARRRRRDAKQGAVPRYQNRLQLACGTCTQRHAIPGKVKRKRQINKQEKKTKRSVKSSKKGSTTATAAATTGQSLVSLNQPDRRKRAAADAHNNNNAAFVPLPDSSPARTMTGVARPKGPQTLAAAAGKKKKIKKTNLMDFLSSLNN